MFGIDGSPEALISLKTSYIGQVSYYSKVKVLVVGSHGVSICGIYVIDKIVSKAVLVWRPGHNCVSI
jgi:hypothetical protein